MAAYFRTTRPGGSNPSCSTKQSRTLRIIRWRAAYETVRGIFRRFDCPELRLTQDVSRRSPPLIHESGQPQYAADYLLGQLESWGLGFSAHRDFPTLEYTASPAAAR